MSGWKVMSSIWNRGGLQHCGLERKNSTLLRMHPTKVQKQTSGEIPFCALTRWCRKGQINLVEHTEHPLRKVRRSLLLGFIYIDLLNPVDICMAFANYYDTPIWQIIPRSRLSFCDGLQSNGWDRLIPGTRDDAVPVSMTIPEVKSSDAGRNLAGKFWPCLILFG